MIFRRLAPLLLAAFSVPASPATAQLGGTVPDDSHFVAVAALYNGEYSQSAKAFLREQRSSVKLPQRWIDSICFHAMRGESLYQMGDNRQALAEFDRACEIFLAYPNWMLRVKFGQPPRADNAARRVAPWGRPGRQVTYARLPETQLIQYGQLDNTQVANQGGTIRQAQYWKVNTAEVVRTTALAIRRRNQLLGPLGPHNRLSRELADKLARGGLAAANHWSGSWMDLLTGLAQQGVYKPKEAAPYLMRSQLLEGRYDHPLTGASLLAQAQLALMTDNGKLVPRLTSEAALAAYAYQDWDVLCDALALGHVFRLGSGAAGVDPVLPKVAAWTEMERHDHVTALVRLLLAEQHAAARNSDKAAALVASALPRRRDVAAGRLGPFADYIAALVAYQQRDRSHGDQALDKSLARYAELSLTNLQLSLANEWFDNGGLSPRAAVGVYQTLLTDPSVGHWAFDPIDALASLRTDHEAAFDRWIGAALARREWLPALYATDLAKRRRFFNRQPLGGRLVAMRALLESPSGLLPSALRLQRQSFDVRLPQYRPAAQQAIDLRGELVGEKNLLADGVGRRDMARYIKLDKLSKQRELMLRELALNRLPTQLVFPPRRDPKQVQQNLQEGDALLVFHQSGDALHGFLVAKQGEHYWRLPSAAEVTARVGELLRAMGNFSNTKTVSAKDLDDPQWRQLATQLGDALLKDSWLDIRQTKRLVIVPDGPLWHLPFEALVVGEPDRREMIGDVAPPRYAPTLGTAFAKQPPPRPVLHTGIAMGGKPSSDDAREMQQKAFERLSRGVENPLRLPHPTPVPTPVLAGSLDALVSYAGDVIAPAEPYEWSPAPIDRNAGAGRLAQWLLLPYEGPERLVLAGVHTAAENGLKTGRSRRNAAAPPQVGSELFHAACGLLASGARTALVSRWQTGGAVHRSLVQEFAGEWTAVSAPDAWRRSVSLARASFLDPSQEPRFKPRSMDDAPPSADHPFFWSGYLLLDSGWEPPEEEEMEEEEGEKRREGKQAAAVKPPAQPQAPPAAVENDGGKQEEATGE